MNLPETKCGAALVVGLDGRLDSLTAPAIQEGLLGILDRGETRLVLDLQQLEYVSSAGLRVFMLAAKKARTLNGKIALASMSEPVREIFDIAGFSALFPVFDTRAAALEDGSW